MLITARTSLYRAGQRVSIQHTLLVQPPTELFISIQGLCRLIVTLYRIISLVKQA